MSDFNNLEATVTIDTTELRATIEKMRAKIERLEEQGYGEGGYGDGEYGGGQVPADDLRAAVRDVMREEWGDDLDDAVGRIMLPSRKIGPAPGGPEHAVNGWGVNFQTARSAHLGTAVVEAGEAGTVTAVLAEYDGSVTTDEVARREVDVEEGVNTVHLDMNIPEAGEYLLYREGGFPLRRREWGGWDTQSREGVTLLGGAKSDDLDPEYAPYDRNSYWYYWFNLQIASSEDAH